MNILSDKHHCAKQKYIDIFLAIVLCTVEWIYMFVTV